MGLRDGRARVLFVLPSLGSGGAEHVMLRLLSGLPRERFEPRLVLFSRGGALDGDVPADVPVCDLGKTRREDALWLPGRLARTIWAWRPDAVVSFLWYANVVTLASRATFRWRAPVAVSERSHPALGFRDEALAEVKHASIRWLYPSADCVLVNSSATGATLVSDYGLRPERVELLPNPLDVEALRRRAAVRPDPWRGLGPDGAVRVVAVGRLAPAKNFPMLVRAFARAFPGGGGTLVIVGEGPERGRITAEAGACGIGARVHLAGYQRDPAPWVGNADVFALSSDVEGLPNALVEAMALGRACVATRCPSGPEELLEGGARGLLVPPGDAVAFGEALRRCASEAERTRLGEAAAAGAEAFDTSVMLPRYSAWLDALVDGWRLGGGARGAGTASAAGAKDEVATAMAATVAAAGAGPSPAAAAGGRRR